MEEKKLLINGNWLSTGKTIDVINPYTGTILAKVAEASAADVERAITSASQAFATTSQMPAHKRAAILSKTSELLAADQENIAEIIVKEAGKSWKYAYGEVGRAVETFRFAAEEARRIHGETVPLDASAGSEKRFGFYLRAPIGVIIAISPFNFPLNLVAHKIAPAIAAGNSVILKPASYTPLTALRLGEIMLEAGVTPGALNIVIGSGSTVGNQLVEDPRPAMVTFTGSPSVGQQIKSKAGMKRVTLELGSNSAAVVDEDAELDYAVSRSLMGSFAYSGQVCISVQRIYLHKSIYDAFQQKFLAQVKALKIGDPMEKANDIGPMITEQEAIRVEKWITEAKEQGAIVEFGGSRNKNLLEPTVLTKVHPQMKIMCKEVFGPLVSLIPFEDFSQAIIQADDSIYGLQAGVFTNNINKTFQAIKNIDAGGIIINDVPTYRADHMPYGGNKLSGLGREGLKFAIEEMTNIKMVCINLE